MRDTSNKREVSNTQCALSLWLLAQHIYYWHHAWLLTSCMTASMRCSCCWHRAWLLALCVVIDIVCNRWHHIWLSKFNISQECNGNNDVMSIICIIFCYILKISSYSTYWKSRSTFSREKNLSISTRSRSSKARIHSESSSGFFHPIPTRSQIGTVFLIVRDRANPTNPGSKPVDTSGNTDWLSTLIIINYIIIILF